MQLPKPIYSLRGTYKNKPYEDISRDMGYLQRLLTKVLRRDGTGFIYKTTIMKELK